MLCQGHEDLRIYVLSLAGPLNPHWRFTAHLSQELSHAGPASRTSTCRPGLQAKAAMGVWRVPEVAYASFKHFTAVTGAARKSA